MKKEEIDALAEEQSAWKERQAKQAAALVRAKLDASLRRIHDLEQELERLTSISVASAEPLVIRPKHGKSVSESTAVVLCSDWHVMEAVDPDTVNGVNSFSPEICAERVAALGRKIILLTNIFRGSTKCETLILGLLGDFINNMIHEDAAESNHGSPAEEVVFAFELISGLIDFLLAHGGFSRIDIPCCVGNHGRDTKKVRASTESVRSYEWILYSFLARHYAGEKRVKFALSKSYHLFQELYGKKIRFHHGHSLSYQGGVGGIYVPAGKAIHKWNQETHASLDCFGHFHQSIYGGNFVANGSIVGYNAYAKRIKASFERPSQSFLMIEKDHWITSFNQLYL